MRTRTTFYMVIFSMIIFGWAFGIVALVIYVQRSGNAKQSHASSVEESPSEIPSLTPNPSVPEIQVFSPTQMQREEETTPYSKFGKILSPAP